MSELKESEIAEVVKRLWKKIVFTKEVYENMQKQVVSPGKFVLYMRKSIMPSSTVSLEISRT